MAVDGFLAGTNLIPVWRLVSQTPRNPNASRASAFFSERFCLGGCLWLTTQFS
jgi:hypothetical protein